MRSRGLSTCAVLAVFGALVEACGGQTPPPTPPSFERPNRIAFACIRADNDVVAAADCCRGSGKPEWCMAKEYDLHALVTQSGRGEVAAVNLASDDEGVVDSRRDVPGYTFVPVGELPSAIVVPPRHPKVTYVANYGSRDLHVLRTQAFLSLPPGVSPVLQVIPIADRAQEAGPVDAVLSPDEDALFVAVPGLGTVLRMPLQRCAAGESACQDGLVKEDEITRIELSASRALAPAAPPAPVVSRDYERLCDFPRPEPPAISAPTVSAAALAVAPRPVSFGIDAFCRAGEACTQRLLVADEALPFIHVIDFDAFASGGGADAVREPLFVGVPTRAVVVTPRVPEALEPDAKDETQFVYAIDATDGTVLALQDGHVLSIDADPEGRADRLPLRAEGDGSGGASVAVALSVLTPGFNTAAPASQYVEEKSLKEQGCEGDNPTVDARLCVDCANQVEDPRRLRGVFLAVAMSDGSVRIVDVHDMELDAGPRSSCRACSDVPIPLLARHHPRIGVTFEKDAADHEPDLSPRIVSPTVFVEGRGFVLRRDGTTNSPDVPGLKCFDCATVSSSATEYVRVYPPLEDVMPDGGTAMSDGGLDGMVPEGGSGPLDGSVDGGDAATGGEGDEGPSGFDRCPKDAPSLVCSISDPWFASEERWAITYEGPIPQTAHGNGRYVRAADPTNASGGLELVVDAADFCAAGVEDGDQVVITSPLVNDRGTEKDSDRCKELKKLADEVDDDRVLIPVVRAFSDRLMLSERGVRVGSRARSIDDILDCAAGAPLAFYVRAGRQAYTVVGSRSGFVHPVVRRADGRCVVPADADPLHAGRAYADQVFQNGRVAFIPRRPAEDEADPRMDSGVGFRLVTPAAKLVFDATQVRYGTSLVMPADLRYSDLDRRLYLIDILSRGLVLIPLDPFIDRTPDSFQ